MKKRVLLSMGTLMLAGLLTGCSTNENDSIVVYSNSLSDGRGDFLIEEAKKAGFEVSLVEGGGGDIENRVIAEKNNPIADVVFGMSTMAYENFKSQDLLAKFTPDWSYEIPEGLSDEDGYYNALVLAPIILAYNTDYYNEEEAPKDWIEVATDSRYKGQYTLWGLGGGTSRGILAGIISRYADEDGELGISDEGWNVVRSYIENQYTPETTDEDYFINLMSGKSPMSMLWLGGLISQMDAHNFNSADLMTPEVGVPYIVEQIAVLEGSKKQEEAKAFVNWFGSSEIQGEWAERFGTTPASPIALEYAPDVVKNYMERINAQPIDWGFVGENIEAWVEKIELEFVKY